MLLGAASGGLITPPQPIQGAVATQAAAPLLFVAQ
jgi:hypothetical protein